MNDDKNLFQLNIRPTNKKNLEKLKNVLDEIAKKDSRFYIASQVRKNTDEIVLLMTEKIQ